MKKIIIVVIVLLFAYFISHFIFGGYLVGFKNNHFVVYSYTCADLCPQQGYWYKRYYGNISYDQCKSMGGEPALVGFVVRGADGKPGPGSIGGYSGCRVK